MKFKQLKEDYEFALSCLKGKYSLDPNMKMDRGDMGAYIWKALLKYLKSQEERIEDLEKELEVLKRR